jgi:hypothetical protein
MGRRCVADFPSAQVETEPFQCTEQLKLNPDLVVESQSIGVAEDASGFNPGTDGILGSAHYPRLVQLFTHSSVSS